MKSTITIVTNACKCTYEEVLSKDRHTNIVYARKLIAHFEKKCSPFLSLDQIGKIVGRDHSTICAYNRDFINNIEGDKNFKRLYEDCFSCLKNLLT